MQQIASLIKARPVIVADFDGVFVKNVPNINTNNLTPIQNAELIKQNTQLNTPFIDELKILCEQGAILFVFTGRRESLLGEFTRNLIAKTGLKITKWFFYPEDVDYKPNNYHKTKAKMVRTINADLSSNDVLFIIDDDAGIIDYLAKHIKFRKTLIQYKFEEYPNQSLN